MLCNINLLTMHFTKLSFEEFMIKVAELIGNTLSDPNIMEAISRFGYDLKRIKEGENIYRRVIDVNESQNNALERKVKIHEERRRLHLAVKKKYMKMLQISRIAFDKDLIIRKALKLDGPREVNLDAWLNQVSLFGNRLIGEKGWAQNLKEYGITDKEILLLLGELDKLRTVSLDCEKSKEVSKKETSAKRELLKELQECVSDYLKIAKIALDEKPELLSKLRD